jgi:hypothetical protein
MPPIASTLFQLDQMQMIFFQIKMFLLRSLKELLTT